jgi:hypothetical protein
VPRQKRFGRAHALRGAGGQDDQASPRSHGRSFNSFLYGLGGWWA